ncbi:MAG: hypothetical protein RSA89_02945 [Raoultibacter sp.]
MTLSVGMDDVLKKEHHITESVWQGYNDYVAGNHMSLEEYDAEEAEWEANCNRRVGKPLR